MFETQKNKHKTLIELLQTGKGFQIIFIQFNKKKKKKCIQISNTVQSIWVSLCCWVQLICNEPIAYLCYLALKLQSCNNYYLGIFFFF